MSVCPSARNESVAPEKLQIKRQEKAISFQASFDKQAMDALEDMLDAVTDKENVAPSGLY